MTNFSHFIPLNVQLATHLLWLPQFTSNHPSKKL